MSWKKKSINIEAEKEIITGMIVDDSFLRDIQTIYHPELFQTPFARIVGRWCIDYHRKYSISPKHTIQEIYNSYRSDRKIDETISDLIGDFLSNLSKEYENTNDFNSSYALDKAEKYFKTRQLELLKDEIGTCLLENSVEKAESKIASFKRVERPTSIGIDIIKDDIEKYLRQKDDILFTFPGILGELFTPFCREDFVAVTAPSSRGKTWWLQEFGMKGLIRGLKIIFYSLEMAEYKMIGRIYQHFLGEAKSEKSGIQYPRFTEDNFIEYDYVKSKGVNFIRAKKKRKAMSLMMSRGQFRLVCSPTGSINVEDIKIHLSNLEHYNRFIPDVIIVDYADILAPERGSGKEHRHKINDTWMALRGLAQEKHCLVFTGTHSNKSTFQKDIDQGDVTEDIRKMNHVTSMIALNQTKEDKKKSIMRLGMLKIRDDEFYVDDEVIVLQCLQVGRPYIDARWKKDVKGLENEN